MTIAPEPTHLTRPAVGLVVHGGRADAKRAARTAAQLLERRGAAVRACTDDSWDHPDGVQAHTPATFGAGLDVVFVFGGDGTFLRAAYLVRDAGVPLLGVDLGRLGFLSEIRPDEIGPAVERIVDGDFAVEDRMTLGVRVHDAAGDEIAASWALNEASFERVLPQRLIVLTVRIGRTLFANIPADGLVCATPTGSTAYAFSARGPILSPLIDAMVLVPVAPHSLFDRAVVVESGESLSVAPGAGDNRCVVSLDGRESLEVPVGGSVQVTRGDLPVRLARLEPSDFYQRVRAKFGLQ